MTRTAHGPRKDDLRSAMRAEARKFVGATVGIPPRNIAFRHPDANDGYFAFDGNPLANALLVVFSAIFPPGERFFVRSVRAFRDRVDDPELAAKMSGFIGQESMHGREHERLNEFFAERGFDVEIPERAVRAGLRVLERFSPTQQLACTTFAEHFTAHLAVQWLTDDNFRKGSDPEMLRLWYWHALEELEHKAVAFDVHRSVGGTYAERVAAGPIVVAALLPGIVYSLGHVLVAKGDAWAFREHARGLRLLFGKRGFLSSVLAHMPEYFAEGFHPSQQDTHALEDRWREALFGDGGSIGDEFKNRAQLSAA